MPEVSTILSLPLIQPSQAQKHVTHNEALRILDVAVQLAVLNRNQTTPPALPALGDRHIIAANAMGDWAGRDGLIAVFGAEGWEYFAPVPGWRAHVLADGTTVAFTGSAWVASGGGGSSTTTPLLGINTTASTTNRLTVSSDSSLFTHDGSGHQVVINKSAPTQTASLVLQNGFVGRAEIGLVGTNNLSVKVSPDGSAFSDAMTVASSTGRITLHQPVILTQQTADPAAPVDGTFWYNDTTGQLKAQVAGSTRAIDAQRSMPWLTPVSGDHVVTTCGTTSTTTGALAGAVGRFDIFPFSPRGDIVVNRLSVNCTAAVAAALCRVAIYAADDLGRPAALILESPDMDCALTGVKSAVVSITMRQGLTYWMGIRHSSTASVSTWPTSGTPDLNGGAPSTAQRKVLRRTLAFATAAPANWEYVSTELNNSPGAAIWLRMA